MIWEWERKGRGADGWPRRDIYACTIIIGRLVGWETLRGQQRCARVVEHHPLGQTGCVPGVAQATFLQRNGEQAVCLALT
jgi:hypothetical protein